VVRLESARWMIQAGDSRSRRFSIVFNFYLFKNREMIFRMMVRITETKIELVIGK
jgi:hypothetical protein